MLAKWVSDASVLCVGDKTPDNLQYFDCLATYFPDAKFVHVIRDGRDVAVSLWHFNLRNDPGKTIQQWGTFEGFVREFAEYWVTTVKAGRRTGDALGSERYLELRYEDLLADPQGELSRALRFLSPSIEIRPEILTACEKQAGFETMSGGRQRGQMDTESFFRKGVAGDWKEHFNEATSASFLETAQGMLRELDYDIEAGASV